jgi:hypothetical protein
MEPTTRKHTTSIGLIIFVIFNADKKVIFIN